MKFSALLSVLMVSTTALGCLDCTMREKWGRKYVGAAMDSSTFGDRRISALFKAEFGSVTPEHSMKWDSIEPSRGKFTFEHADALVSYAKKNNVSVRGHTLVWHKQLPKWVRDIASKQLLTTVIKEHISALVGRYRGEIYAWDVVNEAFNDNGTFRDSVFYRVLGESYIELAFREAHKVDPEAKLYINDYDLDGPGPKIDAVLALASKLKHRGVPIHGIGTQAHLILGDADGVKTQLKRMAGTGLDVAITELDIRIPKKVTEEKLAAQEDDYRTVFNACLAVHNCVGITIWGVVDKTSWVNSWYPTYASPLLFSDTYNRKPAYDGASNALNTDD